MSFQAMIAKTLLKLPESWLVRLSGGRPVEIGGRTLDPYFQFLAHGASRQPPMSSLDPVTARAASADALQMFAPPADPTVSTEDFTLPAHGRDIPVRLYRPETQDPDVPMMVYMHMGGGVIGDLEICHRFCEMLTKAMKAPVLSVDYRLAPEHKFPAGLQDCIFAYEWAVNNAETYGAPAGRVAIGGDSMGGNFTAIIAQEMQRQHKPLPALQLMIYPATEIESDRPSRTLYGETYPLSSDTMEWFMGHYVPEGHDRNDLQMSPGRAADLSGLPPAILVTAGFDPLCDEGEAYAKRLEEAGVATVFKCYETLAHGFTAFTKVSPAANAACLEIAKIVRDTYKSNS